MLWKWVFYGRVIRSSTWCSFLQPEIYSKFVILSLFLLFSDLPSQTGRKGRTDELVKSELVTSDHHTRYANSSSPSDAQSSSDCYLTKPQPSSVIVHSSNTSEVCLRRPADVALRESSIRCICSCISEHGGNCECTEEMNENKGLESNPSKGTQQSPGSSRRKLPVTLPRKQTRRNLNPLSLLRPRSSKRGSLLNIWKLTLATDDEIVGGGSCQSMNAAVIFDAKTIVCVFLLLPLYIKIRFVILVKSSGARLWIATSILSLTYCLGKVDSCLSFTNRGNSREG